MIKYIMCFLTGICMVVIGCERDSINIALPNDEITLKDVSYGTDPFQKMDVYLPANRSAKTKIIVYIHGGSWCTGDKTDAQGNGEFFRQKGLAYIALNYRLTQTPANYINPAQIEDIGKALDFISDRYKQWIITGNRICLFGGSAGGHLAMLYAYGHDINKKVKAVVSIGGPVDLTDSDMRNTPFIVSREAFVGAKRSENKQAWLEASPSYFISENSAPTLFFQGTQDNFVPYHQVVLAYNKLKQLGVNTQMALYTGGSHDLHEIDWDEAYNKMVNFVDTAYP